MMLNVADMVKQNITKILIVSNAIDAVIISLAFFYAVINLEDLSITFGTEKKKNVSFLSPLLLEDLVLKIVKHCTVSLVQWMGDISVFALILD